MLLLPRRVGEKILIGEDVTLSVLHIKGDQIRISIDAPRDMKVNREEVHQQCLKDQITDV